jgi:NTP pyrophosphatase (non-canonical NTP hydrolase)
MGATLKELADKAELASSNYARVNDIRRDGDWFLMKVQEEAGELAAEHLRVTGRGRAGGKTDTEVRTDLENEAADLLGQLLCYCRHYDIDLEAAITRKWFVHLGTEQ